MKNIFRRLAAFALIVCIMMGAAVSASADETSNAKLDLTVKQEGNQVVVTVELKDSTNLTGVGVSLEYDNSKVSFASFKSNKLLDGGNAGVDKGTYVRLTFGGLGSENQNGLTGTLATVTFDIKPEAAGDAEFCLFNGSSSNVDGQPGTVSYVNSFAAIPVQAPGYSITAASVSNGTIQLDKISAKQGETVTITVTPDSEYLISKVTAGSETVTKVNDTTYTFVMPAKNVTVSAIFTAKTYQVNVSAGANGTAKADKTTAAKGETVTVTVSPQSGYAVDRVTVAGVNVTKESSTKYTFMMPGEDTTVSVTFKESSTVEPTEEPTAEPTVEPTEEPTAEPTVEPTEEPTAEPTVEPTEEPAAEPTEEPTQPAPTDPVSPDPVPTKGVSVWIWILILLMAICAAAIGYIIYRHKKNR